MTKFGIFYEHQIPRPWDGESDHRIYREALEQLELADRIGIDYAREVERHLLVSSHPYETCSGQHVLSPYWTNGNRCDGSDTATRSLGR